MAIQSFSEFLVNEEEEGKMYLGNLQEIATFAQKIREMISPDEDLDAWVQDKITIAHHNMDAILGYYKSKNEGGESAATGEVTSMNMSN